MEPVNERLLALRAKAKLSGYVAPAPVNPAAIGDIAFGKQCTVEHKHAYGNWYADSVRYTTVAGPVVRIDGMDVWVQSENITYRLRATACKFVKPRAK
jgi:hypothetical protein